MGVLVCMVARAFIRSGSLSNMRYDLSRIKRVFVSKHLLERTQNRREAIVKHLYEAGVFDYNQVIFVDTGFRGSICRTLVDIMQDRELLGAFQEQYGISFPDTARRFSIRLLGHNSQGSERLGAFYCYPSLSGIYKPYDLLGFNEISGGLSEVGVKALNFCVYFLDEGLEHSVSSAFDVSEDGIVDVPLSSRRWMVIFVVGDTTPYKGSGAHGESQSVSRDCL